MFLRDSDPDQSQRRFTRRAALLGGLQGLGFTILGARLYQLQVMDGRIYAPLAEDNRITTQALGPLRGRIFDRTGRPMADNIETFQAQVIPALATDLKRVLEVFSQIEPLSAEVQEAVLDRARRQSSNAPIILASELSWEQMARLNLNAPRLPGVVTLVAGRRQYHGDVAMGHLVGYTGPVERFALDDDPALRLPGSIVGKSGVEAGRDELLRGRAGLVRREVDARGRVLRELERRDPSRGADVALTIDADVQEAVRQRLRDFRRAAAVVIDIASGEVAAMVSVPGYDPSPFSEGITHKQWQKLVSAKDDPLIDRCVQGQYPPGSTFKMVTALAALEAGVVQPEEKFNCKGAVVLADQKFRCWNRTGHGPCDLHRSLKESCDVYYYEIAQRVGISRIAAMGERLGLGRVFDIGLEAQKPGLLPDPDWKRGALGKSWYDGETLLAGIGQGYVLSTPLQLAVMTAQLISGRAVEPRLVRAEGDDGQSGQRFAKLEISPQFLVAIQRAMRAVVVEAGGTGKDASPRLSGVSIMGKTGTSQVTRLSGLRAQDELAWHHRDHALFVGSISDDRPRYAAAAIVEHGGSGGKVAAPLVRDILEDVLQADPASRPIRFVKRVPA